MANETRFSHLADLVLSARALPGSEREAFLKSACEGDDELYAAALRLAQIPTAEVDRLEHYNPLGPTPERPQFAPGAVFGKYQIVDKIADGGMSTVYRAEHLRSHHRVAVKFLNPSGLRFSTREHEVLGELSHDNIARLFDSDITDEGIPYLVLEYVEGESLPTYCETHALSLEDRLELFLTICTGIQYAHSVPIVHRDIKPENVLVTADQVPKIVDFGIARSLPRDIRAATLTHGQLQPMTLAFASPEQVLGQRVGIPSDIYSLGMLLCVLVTGRLPYRVRTAGDLHTAIPTQEPTRASELVEAPKIEHPSGELHYPYLGPTPPGDEPRRLRRRLVGDLDAIVGKTLRKEPEKRYQTVPELAADVDFFLHNRPVSARKGSTRYRAQKFLMRHKLGVATAALVFLGFFLLLSGLVYQWRQAIRQRDIAQANQDRAETVTQFLVDLFDRSSAWPESGVTQTPEQFIDDATRRLGHDLHSQPQLRSRLLNTLGEIYTRLGSYKKAEPLLQTALAVQRQALGNDHLDVSESLNALGALRLEQGRYPESETLFRQSLAIARRYQDERPDAVASRLSNLSAAKRHEGKFVDAERFAREALVLCEAHPEATHKHLDNVLRSLASALEKQDRYDEAEAVAKRVIQLRTRELGPIHPSTAQSLADFALILHDRGDHAGEERYHRKALQILEATLPPDSPDRVTIMGDLAGALTHLDRLSEAEALQRQVLATYRKVLDPNHPLIGLGINNVAHVLVQEGRYADAADLFRQALPIMQGAYGADSQEVSVLLNNLAGTLARLERYDEADGIFKKAVAVSQEAFGERAVDTGLTLKNYGNLKLKEGRPGEAKPLLEESLDILRTKLPAGHVDLAHAEALIGASLAGLGRYAEAERLEVEGYTLLSQKEAGNKRKTKEVLKHLVRLYSAWGKPKQAAKYQALCARVSLGKGEAM